ncbi:hypothetical protein KR054_010322 [Drosophila jambulina]|nr:hypothetical protein KR054_010322 [Drosophila jambulina]
MFKYLAGIFAKPDNYYVGGRLATPLTTPGKKVPASSLSAKRPRIESHSPVPRPSPRAPKVQPELELDPVSYIVNVSESCSSTDERDAVVPPPASKLPRPIRYDSGMSRPVEQRFNECRSSFLQTQIPGPPPVSRAQSCLSLNSDAAHDEGATNWIQLPYAREECLCCDVNSLEFIKMKTNDWELGWLPEEFWSIDTDTVKVYC